MKKIVLLALATFVFGSAIQTAYAECLGKDRAKCIKSRDCKWDSKYKACISKE